MNVPPPKKVVKKGSKSFQLKNGVLARYFKDKNIQQRQIILPIGHRIKVLEYSHDIPLKGHFGVKKKKEQ